MSAPDLNALPGHRVLAICHRSGEIVRTPRGKRAAPQPKAHNRPRIDLARLRCVSESAPNLAEPFALADSFMVIGGVARWAEYLSPRSKKQP